MLLVHGLQSSSTTWWRAVADLDELGWDVAALDLLGHGARARRTAADGAVWTLDDLADDVAARLPARGVDVCVGHSLGGVIGLLLARRHPGRLGALLLEDPPGLGGSWRTADVADEIERSSARAHDDPVGEVTALLAAHPAWTPRDAQTAVDNRRALDVPPVTACLRGADWRLPELVATSDVPVAVIMAAGADTALRTPDREAVVAALPPDRVLAVASGHVVHRDRPALWLHAVTRFATAVGPAVTPPDGPVPLSIPLSIPRRETAARRASSPPRRGV